MAKSSLTLTCARCGNTFKHIHFSYNRSDANSHEKWAEEHITICPDCYAAEKAAKTKTGVEAYMASFGDRQLPQITGVSAKQIAYAEKLRSAYVADLMRAKVDISAFFRRSKPSSFKTLIPPIWKKPDLPHRRRENPWKIGLRGIGFVCLCGTAILHPPVMLIKSS